MWLKAPEKMASVSVDGNEYRIDEEGRVEIPDAVASTLFEFGLVPTDPPPKKDDGKKNNE